jgi:hypothetical protein
MIEKYKVVRLKLKISPKEILINLLIQDNSQIFLMIIALVLFVFTPLLPFFSSPAYHANNFYQVNWILFITLAVVSLIIGFLSSKTNHFPKKIQLLLMLIVSLAVFTLYPLTINFSMKNLDVPSDTMLLAMRVRKMGALSFIRNYNDMGNPFRAGASRSLNLLVRAGSTEQITDTEFAKAADRYLQFPLLRETWFS